MQQVSIDSKTDEKDRRAKEGIMVMIDEHFEKVALAFFSANCGDNTVIMNKKALKEFVEHLERWGWLIKPKPPAEITTAPQGEVSETR